MANQQQNNGGLIQMLLRDGKLPKVEVEINTSTLVKLGLSLAAAGMLIVMMWFISKKALKNG